jgi:hypothetical protein
MQHAERGRLWLREAQLEAIELQLHRLEAH